MRRFCVYMHDPEALEPWGPWSILTVEGDEVVGKDEGYHSKKFAVRQVLRGREYTSLGLLTEIEELAEEIARASKSTDDAAYLAGEILDLIRGGETNDQT